MEVGEALEEGDVLTPDCTDGDNESLHLDQEQELLSETAEAVQEQNRTVDIVNQAPIEEHAEETEGVIAKIEPEKIQPAVTPQKQTFP